MDNLEKSNQKLFIAKYERRKRLAALPIEEKVKILIKMQEMALPLMKAQGKDVRVWKLE